MRIHKAILGIAFAAISATACAAEISAEEATSAVRAWIAESPSLVRADPAAVESAETLVTASGSRLHVVRLAGGGFAVTSADDRVDPVIAFVRDAAQLVQDDKNPLWALLSGDIAARERAAGVSASQTGGGGAFRAAASESPSAAVAHAQSRWASLLAKSADGGAKLRAMSAAAESIPDVRVDTLIESRWSQDTHNGYVNGKNCYNYYTPSNYVCGCVATLGAQLMRYWRWPQASVAAKTKTCEVDGVAASYTMMGGVYDWDLMPLVPASGATDAQCREIGKLTYDVGVSVCMSWGPKASSANMMTLANRLKDTFGFASAIPVVFHDSYPYSLDRVKKSVIPNCNAKAPIAMAVSGDGGHAAAVDGYGYSADDFYIHVNLGWGGYYDAWYMPPNIDTFTSIDGFVLNVFPEKSGSIVSGRVLDVSGDPVAGATVTLMRNSASVDSTTTDANGIYAFVASAGSYTVTAAGMGVTNTIGVTLTATTGTYLYDNGNWSTDSAASIGSTYDSDISLTGLAGVEAPVFSPGSCMFYPSTNVTITCATDGATIRYTLDGSDPTESSAVYSGPIPVDDDTTIRARAWKSGMNPSPVVGETYTYDAAQGAPKGDYFANPINIAGESGSRVIDDNSAYTVETGEPLHTPYYQYHTVWYKWTAPGSGTIRFATKLRGWNGGTFIAAYTGEELSSLSRIAFSTSWEAANGYSPFVDIEAEQGKTYRIVGMVSDNSYTGEFTLTWSGDLTVAAAETSTTLVPVPHAWLDGVYPGQGVTDDAYEALALSDTDGDGYPAWQEYLLGTDPTNAASRLSATVRMEGGAPVFEWGPTNAGIGAMGYRYVPMGRTALDDAAGWLPYQGGHRFFKVVVEPNP